MIRPDFVVTCHTIHILMPSWRHSHTIDKTLQSIVAGSDPDWICDIFVEPDPAHEVAYFALAQRWSSARIRWTFAPSWTGCGATRNALLFRSAAHYPQIEYCAIADSDDTYHPDRLVAQRQYMIDHPTCSYLSAEMNIYDPATGHTHHESRASFAGLDLADQLAKLREGYNPYANPTVMFRRQALIDFGGYRTDVKHEDYDLWLRLHEAGHPIDILHQPLCAYRGSFR